MSKTKEKAQRAPVSHKRKQNPNEKIDPDVEIKPVFGVTKESVVKDGQGGGIGVRVGNTLMKEQEKEYTPPEKVKDYFAGDKVEERKIDKNIKKFTKFEPVEIYKIATMPLKKNEVKPIYPEALREEEIEGDVFLKVGIDKKGKVRSVKVISSDHELFTKAAVKAMKKTTFVPAKLTNGETTDSVVDIPVSFILDF